MSQGEEVGITLQLGKICICKVTVVFAVFDGSVDWGVLSVGIRCPK